MLIPTLRNIGICGRSCSSSTNSDFDVLGLGTIVAELERMHRLADALAEPQHAPLIEQALTDLRLLAAVLLGTCATIPAFSANAIASTSGRANALSLSQTIQRCGSTPCSTAPIGLRPWR